MEQPYNWYMWRLLQRSMPPSFLWSQKFMEKKISLIVVGFGVFALVAGMAFLQISGRFKETARVPVERGAVDAETSFFHGIRPNTYYNWQTYQDTNSLFTFSYPSNFTVKTR